MKKNITAKLFAVLFCTTLIATSCKDNSTELRLALPTAAGFKELRNQALKDLTQTKTFKAEEPLNFTSVKGTTVSINANCLRQQDNTPVTGDVTLSFIEIFDRGNMTATNKPVMGKDGSGNLLPLVTGGQYNLEIKQGDKTLKTGCLIYVSVPAANTGSLDDAMKLWKGTINEDGNLVWNEDSDAENGKEAGIRANTQNSNYDIWGTSFGWTNVDRFYNDVRPKTQIKVTIPTGYNNTNSGVFLAYENEKNVLAQLDTYDSEEHFFSEHYGFIPIGMNLHVIFVSESNGSIAYVIKKVTIVKDAIINISDSEISTTTKANLIAMINDLN